MRGYALGAAVRDPPSVKSDIQNGKDLFLDGFIAPWAF